MSARRTTIQLVTKATIGFAALFLVSVLLAAMPGYGRLGAAVLSALQPYPGAYLALQRTASG